MSVMTRYLFIITVNRWPDLGGPGAPLSLQSICIYEHLKINITNFFNR